MLQESSKRTTENDNITTIRNLTEDDLEAMYESPGIPVKSMLADEDGVGDVSLVLREKDAESDSANLLVMVAVVPDSTDGWLLDKLKMNGLRVVEYESGNEKKQRKHCRRRCALSPKKWEGLAHNKQCFLEGNRTTGESKCQEGKRKCHNHSHSDRGGFGGDV